MFASMFASMLDSIFSCMFSSSSIRHWHWRAELPKDSRFCTTLLLHYVFDGVQTCMLHMHTFVCAGLHACGHADFNFTENTMGNLQRAVNEGKLTEVAYRVCA